LSESDTAGKKSTFPVRNIIGVRINGSAGSYEMGVIEREFMMAATSHKNVTKVS
jgi:hypothetical protein